jgi:hypothetical protein
MLEFFRAHRLHPAIERTYTMEDYETALKDLAAGNFMGKLVIRLQLERPPAAVELTTLGDTWGTSGASRGFARRAVRLLQQSIRR